MVLKSMFTIAVWLLATQFVSGQVIMITDAGYWLSHGRNTNTRSRPATRLTGEEKRDVGTTGQ
jgi:hypothetical protein